MPIDFNPHFFQNLGNNIQQKITAHSNISFKQTPDTFVKTVNIDEHTNSAYNGITITEKPFGNLENGEEVKLFTITNSNGASVDISNFGATIVSIKVPDKKGNLIDVTQGYDNVTPYEKYPVGHAGGTIGPCANKIDGGKFVINGETYQLETNKDGGRTHCHGASNGFDIKSWTPKILNDGIEFYYLKKDGEGGYPGNVETKVTYKFDNNNNLRIIYSANTDKDTLLNLTNHTYFNLDGAENNEENSILDHFVELPNSSCFTENNEIAVPTGKILKVDGTPFNFKKEHKIKDSINQESDQLKIGSGYDQNYCIDGYDGKTLIDIAKVKSKKTGIKLKVSTNLPGFQFYTANHLGKSTQPNGKNCGKYEKRSALCIEPQFYPNAINTDCFEEKGILKQGEEYSREIVYSFSN